MGDGAPGGGIRAGMDAALRRFDHRGLAHGLFLPDHRCFRHAVHPRHTELERPVPGDVQDPEGADRYIRREIGLQHHRQYTGCGAAPIALHHHRVADDGDRVRGHRAYIPGLKLYRVQGRPHLQRRGLPAAAKSAGRDVQEPVLRDLCGGGVFPADDIRIDPGGHPLLLQIRP